MYTSLSCPSISVISTPIAPATSKPGASLSSAAHAFQRVMRRDKIGQPIEETRRLAADCDFDFMEEANAFVRAARRQLEGEMAEMLAPMA